MRVHDALLILAGLIAWAVLVWDNRQHIKRWEQTDDGVDREHLELRVD